MNPVESCSIHQQGDLAAQALLLDICNDLQNWLQYQQSLRADTCPNIILQPLNVQNLSNTAETSKELNSSTRIQTKIQDNNKNTTLPPKPAPTYKTNANCAYSPTQTNENITTSESIFAFKKFSQNTQKIQRATITIEDRIKKLDELAKNTENCHKCPLAQNKLGTLFGFGKPQPQVLFLGGGFDTEEWKQTRIFAGESGELVYKMIAAMRLTPEDIYFANVIKCVPPCTQKPNPALACACHEWLEQQIQLVNPRTIITWGESAYLSLFKTRNEKIVQVRGTWKNYKGYPTMPTFHPAYLLKNPACKKYTWYDLQLVMKKLNL